MYTVYGDMLSGNCYKIKLLMTFLNIEHRWVHIDILAGETDTGEFLQKNPNAKIPVMTMENGDSLWESNAILNYLAEGSDFLPNDRLSHARVLQWQFFEQYSHEPFIATARYINKYLGLPEDRRAEYNGKQAGGHKALQVMDEQLGKTRFFVGDTASIADISLYAYTHVADEGGFELGNYRNILRWFQDFESIPGYIKMSRDNA